jgi:hypothetical protein
MHHSALHAAWHWQAAVRPTCAAFMACKAIIKLAPNTVQYQKECINVARVLLAAADSLLLLPPSGCTL